MSCTVVLLNGPGSAGKTSIARALQVAASRPFLHVSMDAFLDMLPGGYDDHPDGLRFRTIGGDGPTEMAIETGPVANRLLAGMRASVAALADAGNDLVVDEVLLDDGMADYERRLAGHRLIRVAVTAPLAVLEARERARGDRLIGLARWQVGRVHAGKSYDLRVDTAAGTAEECARRIVAALGL